MSHARVDAPALHGPGRAGMRRAGVDAPALRLAPGGPR